MYSTRDSGQISVKFNLSDKFYKNTQVTISTKIRPSGADSLHADRRRTNRRADMTKLIVTFRSSSNAPKNWILLQLNNETPFLNKFWSTHSAWSHEEKSA